MNEIYEDEKPFCCKYCGRPKQSEHLVTCLAAKVLELPT